MFCKILIANRGEIACRVIRTARRLGIATVAVYSEADRGALHVEEADEAWPIGPAPARESYLNIGAIIAAARASGAEAVHPGYGFLSENADFAEACEEAGLVFIGPPAEAMRAMGSKAAAKALMARAGVPVVPGYHGDDQDPGHLAEEARRIGFPVLIKASAGGGGRGMRVVAEFGEFAAALEGAKREAAGAFGDDRVLIEKYLTRPRHIEVQIFADRHGNAVHIFDRDCSIQRRHQKVIEEAPAPGLDARAAPGDGRGRGRRGARGGLCRRRHGRVHREADTFYFIEMNTRLQVEHTVTEAVTGLDLVEWQLRVAAGEKLPLRQKDLVLRGHAIEARLYAEDPERDFVPQTGTLHGLRFPPPEIARVDTGVRQGDSVTPYYDAMIAKIIAWGEDRQARSRGCAALLPRRRSSDCAAILGFWRGSPPSLTSPRGRSTPAFIERHRAALIPAHRPAPDVALAAAAISRLRAREAAIRAAAQHSGDPYSPWAGNRRLAARRGRSPGSDLPRRCRRAHGSGHGSRARLAAANRRSGGLGAWRAAAGRRLRDNH